MAEGVDPAAYAEAAGATRSSVLKRLRRGTLPGWKVDPETGKRLPDDDPTGIWQVDPAELERLEAERQQQAREVLGERAAGASDREVRQLEGRLADLQRQVEQLKADRDAWHKQADRHWDQAERAWGQLALLEQQLAALQQQQSLGSYLGGLMGRLERMLPGREQSPPALPPGPRRKRPELPEDSSREG